MGSTLARLPHTPLQDLLRGRVTGRLDWRQSIASCDIAPEVKDLVTQVVGGTRLWPSEKAQVAAELLDHFADGLASGASSTELIDDFGDTRLAARLIRRSKIRNQSILWQMFRWGSIGMAILLVFYCGLGALFYAGHPSPKVDFIAELNNQIEQTPVDQRAWPIYRSVLLLLRSNDGKSWSLLMGFNPEGKHWPQIARWIDEHALAVESIRRASKLPVLGFLLGKNGSVADPALFGSSWRAEPSTAAQRMDGDFTENLANLRLPQLEDTRVLADLLCFDAKRAREQGQGDRVEQDIAALSGLANQVRHDGELYLGQMASLGILIRSYDQLDRTLVNTPQLFDEAALGRIAHLISAPKTGSDLIGFRGERLLFEDIIQRSFTDDGYGDGRFSSGGVEFVRANFSGSPDMPEAFFVDGIPGVALEPASLLLMGSRKELLDENQRLMAMEDVLLSAPLRGTDSDSVSNEWRSLTESRASQMRYSLLIMLMRSVQQSAQLSEQTLGVRDGLLVGIALELYHRRHQCYPGKLVQLAPGLLLSIPADRITGEPLKYRLINGVPLVYSVGVDRVDDGGRMPVQDGKVDPDAAAGWGPTANMISGDWVLYPKPRVAVGQEQEN